VFSGSTDTFSINDELGFWSLIESLATGTVDPLIPEFRSVIETEDDVRQHLTNRYCLTGSKANCLIRKLIDFVRAHGCIIKIILAVQASSAESERLFSFSERCYRSAPSRKMRTIADMALVRSYFDSHGFENDVPRTWKDIIDRMVQYALYDNKE
jgi:hypothetical protein